MAGEARWPWRHTWGDVEWRALSPDAKLLHGALTHFPSRELTGTVPWSPRRFASLCEREWTVRKVEGWANELVAADRLLVDGNTDEAWLCRYLREDEGLLRSPNMVRGIVSRFWSIQSAVIRACVLAELAGAYGGLDVDGRRKLRDVKGFPELLAEPFEEPFPEDFPKPYWDLVRIPVSRVRVARAPAPSPAPAPGGSLAGLPCEAHQRRVCLACQVAREAS